MMTTIKHKGVIGCPAEMTHKVMERTFSNAFNVTSKLDESSAVLTEDIRFVATHVHLNKILEIFRPGMQVC